MPTKKSQLGVSGGAGQGGRKGCGIEREGVGVGNEGSWSQMVKGLIKIQISI